MDEENSSILQDVELRLQALAESRQFRLISASVLQQLQDAKAGAAAAEHGSLKEQKYLQEAMSASERLAALQSSLYRAEREIRRTDYLLDMLAEQVK